jgi:hypothetical protein
MVQERAIRFIGGETAGPLPRVRSLNRPIALLSALAVVAAHVLANPHYGFFRDELYFIICGRHPAIGYVDQPPLVPLLAAWSQSGGPSLEALRAVPALFAGVATYVSCLLAEDLGGGVFAVALTAALVAFSPVLMAFGARLSPDSVELAIWPLLTLLVVRIVRGADPRLWLAVGALTALAAYGKYSIVFFVAAMLAGLLLTAERRILWSRWFAAGALLCGAAVAPNLAWQWQHGWPMVQVLLNDYGMFSLAMPYPVQQIVITDPVCAIAWIAGLVWLARRRSLRFITYAYALLIGAMWALNGKDYYPASVYPALFAAGAVAMERWTTQRRGLRLGGCVALAVSAILCTPFVVPVLPMRSYIAYQKFIGRALHTSFHLASVSNDVPIQYYADMSGWRGLAREVGRVYASLPVAQRAHAAILAQNFGEASAIDFYRSASLPPALSGNNNYWLWGPRGYDGNVVIDVNDRALLQYYGSVRRVALYSSRYEMPYENRLPIWILRHPRLPLAALWPRLKRYAYGFRLPNRRRVEVRSSRMMHDNRRG